MTRLVVVSNRVPSAAELAPEQEGAAAVGGLVKCCQNSDASTTRSLDGLERSHYHTSQI